MLLFAVLAGFALTAGPADSTLPPDSLLSLPVRSGWVDVITGPLSHGSTWAVVFNHGKRDVELNVHGGMTSFTFLKLEGRRWGLAGPLWCGNGWALQRLKPGEMLSFTASGIPETSHGLFRLGVHYRDPRSGKWWAAVSSSNLEVP